MPPPATPFPVAPTAQPVNPARGATSSRAAEGFAALVDAEARGDKGADNLANGAVAQFVANGPVEATARPADGSVFDALSTQLTAEPPENTDLTLAGLTEDQAKADLDLAKTEPVPVASAIPEPTAIDDAVIPPGGVTTDTPVSTAIESEAATEIDTNAATAREARVADALQRLEDRASAPKPDAQVQVQTQTRAKATPQPAAKPEAVVVRAEAEPSPTEEVIAEVDQAATDDALVDAEILAPLKEGRPASERAPGELIRSDARSARAGDGAGPSAADAKANTGEAKPAVSSVTPADVKPAPSVIAPAQTQAPATTPNPSLPPPPLELLLGQMEMAQMADAPLSDAPLDPALSKSDAAFDPAAARTEARSEIRTASTLQFAQGPRLTPQSAQTMAAQIAQRFNDGARVFDIRLDPPELGRVEVRLEVGKDNSVRAILAAERTETLAELQRSARDLERALTEAGLDVGEDALTFSLTEDNAFSDEAEGDTGPETPVFQQGDTELEALAGPLPPLSTYGFLLTRAEGLDVSV